MSELPVLPELYWSPRHGLLFRTPTDHRSADFHPAPAGAVHLPDKMTNKIIPKTPLRAKTKSGCHEASAAWDAML